MGRMYERAMKHNQNAAFLHELFSNVLLVEYIMKAWFMYIMLYTFIIETVQKKYKVQYKQDQQVLTIRINIGPSSLTRESRLYRSKVPQYFTLVKPVHKQSVRYAVDNRRLGYIHSY